MHGPGYDIESLTGLAAGGAQLIIFTTGRGNPIGFPIVPVIKIASTTQMFEQLRDDMDLNAGDILQGISLKQKGDEVKRLILKVTNGGGTAPTL